MRSRLRGAPADRFEVVLLDLDGTVYVWPEPVPGSPEAMATLRAIDLVVVGGSADLGSRELTVATRALRGGARLFGSNRDPVFPTPRGRRPPPGRTSRRSRSPAAWSP
jgi:ribonucleotide monophosphatase NagD (HAD superfamily)